MCAITIRTEVSSIGTNAVAIYTETIDSGNVLRISAQNNRTTVQIHWTVNSQGMPRHLQYPLYQSLKIQIFHRIISYRIKEHTSSTLTVCLSYTSVRVFDTLFRLIFQMSLTPMIFKYTKFLEFLKGTSYPVSGVKSDTSDRVKIVI